MVIEVLPSFRKVVLEAYVKLLIRGLDNLRWDHDHDKICLSQYEKQKAEFNQELQVAKAELKAVKELLN